MKSQQSWGECVDKTSSPSGFLRPDFQNSFPYIQFWFSTLSSIMSRNVWKLRHKLHNKQYLPPWIPNVWNNFSLTILRAI